MTRFIDVPMMTQLINTVGIDQTLIGVAATLKEDFSRWQEFDKCARVASHSDVGVIELMPVSDGTQYGFKYVNGHPSNPQKGMSTVMAFGALADVDTGYPVFLSELTLATALRTAATSAITAKALARKNARILAMIGAGAQSEFQALAFQHIVGIEEIRIYDIDQQAMEKFRTHMATSGMRIISASSAREAVRGADIVSTCTADKAWATILTRDMIEPGMHINAIGGDCPGKTELEKSIVLDAEVFVEYEPQTRVEGEIQQVSEEFAVTELWRIFTGEHVGRSCDSAITLFDSVGFALEDFSVLRFLFEQAKKHSVGADIELIPDLSDPKDLFHKLTPSSAQTNKQNIKVA